MDPKAYAIANVGKYENPDLYEKTKVIINRDFIFFYPFQN